MRKKFELSTEEYLAIQARMKENRDKRIDKRLQVLILRHEGKAPKEIIEKLNLSRSWIMQLCKDYREKGLEEYCHLKYDGHHRSLSEAEEDEILATFQEKANAGQIVTVKEIKAAFDANPDLANILLDPYFSGKMAESQAGWRNVVAQAIMNGIPAPCLIAGLEYYDGYRCDRLPANLLQAQRDFFGAHTYERTDRPRGEFFHTNWTGHGGDTVAGTYTA